MRSELVVVGLGLPGEEERGGEVGYVVESGIVGVRIALVALELLGYLLDALGDPGAYVLQRDD